MTTTTTTTTTTMGPSFPLKLAWETLFLVLAATCARHAWIPTHKATATSSTRNARIRTFAAAVGQGFALESLYYLFHEPKLYRHDSFVLMVPRTGIPVYILCMWTVFLYVSHTTVTERWRSRVASPAWVAALWKAVLVGGINMSLDLTMEPMGVSLGMWRYFDTKEVHDFVGERWNGNPLKNLLAWFFLGWSFSAASVVVRALPTAVTRNVAVSTLAHVVVGVVLCAAGNATIEPLSAAVGMPNAVKLAFLVAGLVAALLHASAPFGRSNIDPVLLGVVVVWHAVPLVLLLSSPHREAFSRHALVELAMLGVASTAAFALPDPALGHTSSSSSSTSSHDAEKETAKSPTTQRQRKTPKSARSGAKSKPKAKRSPSPKPAIPVLQVS